MCDGRVCEQALHRCEETFLPCEQQVSHTFLHVPVAREQDGFQECQHLPHNLVIGVGQQGNYLGEAGANVNVLCSHVSQCSIYEAIEFNKACSNHTPSTVNFTSLRTCVFRGFSQRLCSGNMTLPQSGRSFRTPAYSGPCNFRKDPPTGSSCH